VGIKKLKTFTFRLSEEKKENILLIKFIEDQAGLNTSRFIKDILMKYSKGDLIEPRDSELKIKKLKVDIEFKEVCTLIKRKELLHWETFSKTPSWKAQKAIKEGVSQQIFANLDESPSCYDEKNNRFQCPECGILFVFANDHSDISESKSQFADHYFQKHGLVPDKIVREIKEIL